MLDTNKPYIVFNNKLGGWLIMNDQKLLRVRPDIKNPANNVYIFKNSDNLRSAVNDYTMQGKSV